MLTNSIYLNNNYSQVSTYSDRAAACGVELATVDRLLSMGYRFCNHVRLSDRQRELIAEIARLEDLARALNGKFFRKEGKV